MWQMRWSRSQTKTIVPSGKLQSNEYIVFLSYDTVPVISAEPTSCKSPNETKAGAGSREKERGERSGTWEDFAFVIDCNRKTKQEQ